MQDGGMNVRCEHQCKQQWTETATDEDVCCFCFVVSVFVVFGDRTLQLCVYIVASVFATVGVRTMQMCSLAPSLARSLAVFSTGSMSIIRRLYIQSNLHTTSAGKCTRV